MLDEVEVDESQILGEVLVDDELELHDSDMLDELDLIDLLFHEVEVEVEHDEFDDDDEIMVYAEYDDLENL